MDPSKQESISRQSSILKPPKQRQPLQCVAPNPSSSENSPTIKLKRRVSFAKNKRIREFCNEVEPKEGLDDSYEEHDLSNTKSSSGNSTDHPLVISVACEDKENFPIQLFVPTGQIDQIECKEIQAASPGAEEDNLSQCEMEMDKSFNIFQSANTELQNKEMALPDSTIYFNDGMDITTSVQPQIISTHAEEEECYNDTLPVSQTYVEDVPMEMTENLQSLLSKKPAHGQNTNHNIHFEYNASNFTEPVSTILGIGNIKKSIESQRTKPLSRSCENETECFTDMPLEFTSVIPSSTWIRPHNQSQNNDETERFNCKTMEFTEVVQLRDIMCKSKTGVDNISEKVTGTLSAQKDSIVPNSSVKQSQQIEVSPEKNNVFSNDPMVTTEAKSNEDVINKISNANHNSSEKTKIFPNVSMEITEAVPVYNEIKSLPVNIKGIQQEIAQDKTKIFYDQSMELTGAPSSKLLHFKRSEKEHIQSDEKTRLFKDTSMDMTEVIASQSKIPQQVGFKNLMPKLETNKTKVFVDTSMEMTEAVPVRHKSNSPIKNVEKSHVGSMQDRTRHFNDNSMEITEALGINNIEKSRHCHNQSMAPRNEKTQVFVNASMEITEAVPVSNKINKSILKRNKSHHEITQDRTKLFHDKSMEETEAVLHYNKIPLLSKLGNQVFESSQEKTKFFCNASMEMTEGVHVLLGKDSQPFTDLQKIHGSCNNSMEITEAVSVNHNINQSNSDQGKNQQEITENETKIFQNKSMEVTEAVLNYNKPNLLSNSKNQLIEPTEEQTKFFFNASMDITEAAPIVRRNKQLESELKSVFCGNVPEQTEVFQNNSMEMTEAVKNTCSNNHEQEKTKMFPNMSITETIPVNKEIWQCNIRDNAALSKQSEEVSVNNKTMEKINNLNENRGIEAKKISVSRDESTKYFGNKSMDFTEVLPGLEHQNASSYSPHATNEVPHAIMDETKRIYNNSMELTEAVMKNQNSICVLPGLEHQNASSYSRNEVPHAITDETKRIYNNSMELTETVMKNQNSICANPSISTNSFKDSERSHQYDGSSLNKMDIQNFNPASSKKDNIFNVSNNHRDKSFHRMTTDELNTLCASMNIPTQNYATERNSTMQNDYISICNDVNVLRDSLKKNTIFQQNFTIGAGISMAMDNNMQMSINVNENAQKQDDLQIFCDTDCNSVGRSITPRKEQSKMSPTEIDYQKEYDAMDEHVFKKGNVEFPEIKSPAVGIGNSKDQNIFSISSQSLKNAISRTNAEYSNSTSNEKEFCETQNNIHSFGKNETLQIHNISKNSSRIKKSTAKRKSTEIDENDTIAENSLKRLPSDNTELLVATMGFKTELSHPLIINDKTIIKVPSAPRILSSCSNETIQFEEDNEETSKSVTTSTIQNQVFDEVCDSSNKGHESPANRKSNAQTELFSGNSMNELDEIQPPSFLCSDSFQTDSMADAEMLNNKSSDIISREIIQEQINVRYEKEYCGESSNSSNSRNSSIKETRQSFENGLPPANSMDGVAATTQCDEENRECVSKLAFFNHSKELDDSMISLINEEAINTDPLAPFLSLTESIEAYEKRDDCIWTIRKIDQKTVAVDFISNSFVTIIRLNEIEKACIKDIDNIEFISRLHCGSKNTLLKIVHRLLLTKLEPDKLLSEYKMYEDVLPLLDYVSNEVILAMNFMFDVERLSALNLLSIDSERVLFLVSSKKANIILEISLMLKVFNEIGPDDISVTCVLGDVRIDDIKRLIVNIRKDSAFLSRYINDVKDYILIMEESTHLQR